MSFVDRQGGVLRRAELETVASSRGECNHVVRMGRFVNGGYCYCPLAMQPVFVHISKNAGTSIVASAGDQIMVAGHQAAASWVAHNPDSGPILAVVRNPYGRVVSEYSYRRKRYLRGEDNPHLANLHLPIDEWVAATFGRGEFRTQAFFDESGVPYARSKMVDGCLIWFVSQRRWLCDADGELLTDHILRFESLDEDWRAFASAHGIERELGHINASRAPGEVGERFDQATRDLIYNYYQDDFDLFGYDR